MPILPESDDRAEACSDEPLCLHIGGRDVKAGWKNLDVRPGPHVEFVDRCTDLSICRWQRRQLEDSIRVAVEGAPISVNIIAE